MIDPNEILECQRRWEQAVAAGEVSARRATTEALAGCAAALHEIARGLGALRYPVTSLIVPSAANLDELVAHTEESIGQPFPAVLVEFWRTVGGVTFVDLEDYAHVEFWEEAGVRAEYCDGLMVDACTADWAEFAIEEHEEMKDERASGNAPPYLITLAPDGYHKDDISGGAPYGLLPGHGWRATWANFDWVGRPASATAGPLDFMAYLRTSILECAGFPGLHGDEAFEPIRRRLLQDVKAF